MAKKKKNKAKNKAFNKVKLKVGKVLKKQNETDTRFTAKKVVILEQLAEKSRMNSSSGEQSLTVQQLCQHLSHSSRAVRKDAISRLKKLIGPNAKEIVAENRRFLISPLLRSVTDVDLSSDLRSELGSLIELVFAASESAELRPHFALISAQILAALNHLSLPVKLLALDVCEAILRRFPDDSGKLLDLTDGLHEFVASVPISGGKSAKLMGENGRLRVLKFLEAFSVVLFGKEEEERKLDKKSPENRTFTISLTDDETAAFISPPINLGSVTAKKMPFYFPLFDPYSRNTARRGITVSSATLRCYGSLVPFLNQCWLDAVNREEAEEEIFTFSVDQLENLENILRLLLRIFDKTDAILENSVEPLVDFRDKCKQVLTKKFRGNFARVLPVKHSEIAGRKSPKRLCKSVNDLLEKILNCFSRILANLKRPRGVF